jgi:uncharacterized protein (TIGR02996 family)
MSDLRRALEDALAENPDDLATHSAYADLLSEQGDPRGEFIQVQLALEDPSRPPEQRRRLQERERELLAAHEREWLGHLAPYLLDQQDVYSYSPEKNNGYKHTWRRGWIHALDTCYLNVSFAVLCAAHPLLRLLHDLDIPHQDYDAPGWDELLHAPWLGNVRGFQIGDHNAAHCHTNGAWAHQFVERMPRLEILYLYAFEVDTDRLFALPMPALRQLIIDDIEHYPLEILAQNPTLGRLERLSFFPHALRPGDMNAYITFESGKALVHGPHLTSLRHLKMVNTGLGDPGCEEIVKSGVLKRLKVLILRNGCITDVGARTLAACPDLRNLERLELTGNFLTGEGRAVLEATGVPVDIGGQYESAEALEEKAYLWEEGDME